MEWEEKIIEMKKRMRKDRWGSGVMDERELSSDCRNEKAYHYRWDGLGAVGQHEALQRNAHVRRKGRKYSRRMNVDYHHRDCGCDSRRSPWDGNEYCNEITTTSMEFFYRGFDSVAFIFWKGVVVLHKHVSDVPDRAKRNTETTLLLASEHERFQRKMGFFSEPPVKLV